MLGKLFKYDLLALSRVLVPLHIAVLGVAVLGVAVGLAGHVFGNLSMGGYRSSTAPLLNMFIPVSFLCVCAMLLSTVATEIVIIHRFYCNLFTDEGYLTLTLPVSAHQIVLSKFLSGLLWMGVNALVAVAVGGAATAAVPGLFASSIWGETIISVGNGFAQIVVMLLGAYAAFALGAVLSPRHKVAASVGLCALFAWLGGMFIGIFSLFVASLLAMGDYGSYSESMMWLPSMVGWAASLIVASGCYTLCAQLVGRRANLA